MKKVYLVHGWGGSDSSEGWFGWLKKKLKEKGVKVMSFNMPNTDKPKIEEWVGFLEKNVKEIDKETYFIGHSVGCQAILRFLEELPGNSKVGGCVFVAPWMELNESTIEEEGEEVIEIAKLWVETPIDFNKVKEHCKNFLSIFSDNDPYVPLGNKKLFEKSLNSKIFVLHGKEHFNEVLEIPEILDFFKN